MMQRILAKLAPRAEVLSALRLAGPALLVFAAGAGVLQLQATLADWRWPAGAAAVMAVVLGAMTRRRWGVAGHSVRWALVLSVALLSGFSWSAWRAELRLGDALPVDWERRDIQVVGVVAELPRQFERGERFLFRVEVVETPGAQVPERLLLSWYRTPFDAHRELRPTAIANPGAAASAGDETDSSGEPKPRASALVPGERWRLTVRLKRPHGHLNPGGFDYEAWLLERAVRATGYVRAAPVAEALGRADGLAGWLRYGIERARWQIRHNLQKNLPDAAWAGVVVALAIGDQGSMPADAWRVFAATGTTHLMSISGLHVTMLAALVGLLVGAVWRRVPVLAVRLPAQRAAIFAGWWTALLYTLLAGAGIPALRTLLMLSVAAAAHGLSRSVPVQRVLSLALALVLLFDPWAVLAVGFWLSFGAVAVLLLLVGEGSTADRAERNALAASGLPIRPPWLSRLGRWGVAQWAVTLGTLPMLIWMFQQFSLVSPLANALAIPLISMLVAPLAVAAGLLPVPWLATLAEWPLQPLMVFLVWLAEQPWALWRQPQPALWAVLLAAAGVVIHLWPGLRWSWRLAALLLVAPALFPRSETLTEGEARIDVLDVGHGLSVLVRTRKHTLLFDGGPRYSADSDAGERIVVPVARAAGIEGFSGIVLSHQDSDHSGGIESAWRELPVGWFSSSLPTEHRLLVGQPDALRCVAGQTWQWDGVRFEFLSPPASYYERKKISSNRMSCVLLIRVASGRSMLLTADAEAPEEALMLAALAGHFPVDVLQVPHQGSRSSSSAAFVQAAAPKVAIFPVGYRNPFGHPHAEVVQRYEAIAARALRTDQDGAVRVRLGKTVEVSTARAERPRYWHGR